MQSFIAVSFAVLGLASLSAGYPSFRNRTLDLTRDGCSCGVSAVKDKIVGGQAADSGEFPWRVSLWSGPATGGMGSACGGTIISSRWILTAAHCYDDWQDGFITMVGVGSNDNAPSITAKQHIVHWGYDGPTMVNDLTLIELDSDLDFTDPKIQPACLPYPYAGQVGMTGEVTGSGWGNTVEGGESPSTLQKVVLPLISNEQCKDMDLVHPPLNDQQTCTYQAGKDTCQGDSGGSIDFVDNGIWYAFGVVSHGLGCARENAPGVYGRISEYTDWIEKTTQKSFCKP